MWVDSSVICYCIKDFLRLSFSYDILVWIDFSITLVFFKGCSGVRWISTTISEKLCAVRPNKKSQEVEFLHPSSNPFLPQSAFFFLTSPETSKAEHLSLEKGSRVGAEAGII